MTRSFTLLGPLALLVGCQGGSSAAGGTTTGNDVRPTTSAAAATSGTGPLGTGFFAGVPLGSNGCPLDDETVPMTECDAGVEVVWNLVDYCANMTPLAQGANVQISDYLDESVQPVVEDCGYVYACVPAGEPVVFLVQGPNYYTELSPSVLATGNFEIPSDPGMYLFCSELALGLESLPDFNPDLAVVAAQILPVNASDGGCGVVSGWSLALTDVDGGALDAGLIFASGTGLAPGTVTTSYGLAIFYNVDPTVQNVLLVGNNAGDDLSDGGTACPNLIGEQPYPFSAQFPVKAEAFTDAPYVIP